MQIFFSPCPSLCPLPSQHRGRIFGPRVHAEEPRIVPAVRGLQPKRKKTITSIYILIAAVTWKKDSGILRILSKVCSSQWECLCQSLGSSMGRVLDLHAHVTYLKAYVLYGLDIQCVCCTSVWTVQGLPVRRSFYSEHCRLYAPVSNMMVGF